MTTQRITLAGGCFWCVEAVYELVDGVVAVESGYSNGHAQRPSYEQVCSGDTGHAEVLRIDFDTARITLREILEIFFSIHDPTTLNRQGNDVGTQYRSSIFYHSPGQKAEAQSLLAAFAADNAFGAPVVTELAPAGKFYPAEDYHQDYFRSNPHQPYCQVVVAPKLAKFRKLFAVRRKLK